MPRTRPVAIVERRTDRNRVAIRRQRHRVPELVKGGGALDVTTDLHPCVALEPENPNMPRTRLVAIAEKRTDRNRLAVGGQRHSLPECITVSLALDVTTDLRPPQPVVGINPGVSAPVAVPACTNDNCRTICGHRNRNAQVVFGRCAIETGTYRRPLVRTRPDRTHGDPK